MPHWESEQQETCAPGVTCLHMDPHLLLTREGKSCLPAPVTKLSAWAPAPDLASRSSIVGRWRAGGAAWHSQTSPEPPPKAGLVPAGCLLGNRGCLLGKGSVAFAAGWR